MGSHIHLMATASEISSGLSDIIRDMKKYISKMLLNWIKTSGVAYRILFVYISKTKMNK